MWVTYTACLRADDESGRGKGGVVEDGRGWEREGRANGKGAKSVCRSAPPPSAEGVGSPARTLRTDF